MRIATLALGLVAAATAAFAEPQFGMMRVYAPVDEATGLVDCADDLKEAAESGITLVTHAWPGAAAYTGLDAWITAHPEEKTLRDAAALVFPDDAGLALQLYVWTSLLKEASRQGGGKLKVLVGPLWDSFVDPKAGVRTAPMQRFIQELCAFEKGQAPDTVGGWLLADEPLGPRTKANPTHAKPALEAMRAGEEAATVPPHRVWVAESPSRPPKDVGAFLAVADALLVVRDPWLWSVDPPARVDQPQFERIPHSLRLAREIAKAVKNEKLELHIVLQAFDHADDDMVQPSHWDMHQQVRLALSGGMADLGSYAGKPAWVEPAAGIWLAGWSDVKSHRSGPKASPLNRWDEPQGADWKEALDAERKGEAGAVHVTRDETWAGNLTIIGDVIVHKGATLTIQPGAMVRVLPLDHYQGGKDKKHVEFVVQGTLVVKGNEQMKVVFRPETQDPTLVSKPRKAQKGDWYGFRVEAGGKVDRNKFTYVNDAQKD